MNELTTLYNIKITQTARRNKLYKSTEKRFGVQIKTMDKYIVLCIHTNNNQKKTTALDGHEHNI